MKLWAITHRRSFVRSPGTAGGLCAYWWKSEAEYMMDELQRNPDYENMNLKVRRIVVFMEPTKVPKPKKDDL